MKGVATTVVGEPEAIPTRRLLRAGEAADYIGVSERTLWAMTNSGEIPTVRFGSGTRQSVRVDLADLDSWIDKHKGGGR